MLEMPVYTGIFFEKLYLIENQDAQRLVRTRVLLAIHG